jgi:putative transposase
MILTCKLKHDRDFSDELKRAFVIAKFAVDNPRCRSSKAVKEFGLPSAVSNQILMKYGHQKNIKRVHNVNLIVPGQAVRYFEETNSIWIPCLKLHLENTINREFTKINQIELDNEYAHVSYTVPEAPEMIPYEHVIGVDRNTTGHVAVSANLTTGQVRKMGKKAQHIHTKYRKLRTSMQKDGQYRKVKRIKNRENRIVKDLNHKISRHLVDMAQAQHAALVFEDLSGIRNTKKQHRSFKPSLHSWSFYQLQQFVEYKAKLLGVPVIYVDPAYTSQDCSRCGARGQRYKKAFNCPACGHADHADVNAAFNIALRQKDMIARIQTKMCTMGTLISHDDALLEREYR